MTDTPPSPRPARGATAAGSSTAALVYCAVAVPALTVWRPDAPLVAQVVMALIGLATTVIVTYALGAVWDDKNARKASQ